MEQKEFVLRLDESKQQLYKTAYFYLNNEASALEAVDESVYRALKGLKKLRQPEYFTTWMTRIVINECKKELKRQGRISPYETLPIVEEVTEVAYDGLPLREAINLLPEALQAVIGLRYFAGYTLAQTATILEIPQGTVVSRVRRALALLRMELAEEEEQ